MHEDHLHEIVEETTIRQLNLLDMNMTIITRGGRGEVGQDWVNEQKGQEGDGSAVGSARQVRPGPSFLSDPSATIAQLTSHPPNFFLWGSSSLDRRDSCRAGWAIA